MSVSPSFYEFTGLSSLALVFQDLISFPYMALIFFELNMSILIQAALVYAANVGLQDTCVPYQMCHSDSRTHGQIHAPSLRLILFCLCIAFLRFFPQVYFSCTGFEKIF